MKDRDEDGKFVKGHLVNQKYSNEDVIEIFDDMYISLLENPEEYTMAGLLADRDLSWEWLRRVRKRKGEGTEAIREAIKKVETKLESRIIQRVMNTGKAQTMGIFLLKNKHGYVDERKTDVTTQGEKIAVLDLGGKTIKL